MHRMGPPTTLVPMPLTERDKAILDFERSWFTQGGVKETAILERFELSASRYYQILGDLLEAPDVPAALERCIQPQFKDVIRKPERDNASAHR